ncbi:BLUF domain-containing protein [Verminephrobacter eiseniae]|uniref:BLUF domain-containing protein n=1 Tax=Verminephrobacter eiseniae TaxID=364317 RepID=UPI002238DFB9|nr:BLUF domain-containing protein [Verminephrobacter eiseniae]MCW5259244.1 BLUF domain-containing protein [Verminephrobacter eiseniae]
MSNEALSQFVYYSTLADGYDATCVGAIIKTARAFNASNGITGVLLFDGERFCQYIEGNPVAVNALVDRIRQDPRHKVSRPCSMSLSPRDGGTPTGPWLSPTSAATPSSIR